MRIIAALLVLAFLFNYPILALIYPEHVTDYYVFLDFYKAREIVYEAMFTLFFFLCMKKSQGFINAVCKFGFMLSFASFFDKAILDINQYLQSDVLLVMLAFEISIVQWAIYDGKNRRRGQNFFS